MRSFLHRSTSVHQDLFGQLNESFVWACLVVHNQFLEFVIVGLFQLIRVVFEYKV